MKVTKFSSDVMRYRRAVRKLKSEGYEEVELYRNYLTWPEIVTDVVVGPDRTSIWWKKGTDAGRAALSEAEGKEG